MDCATEALRRDLIDTLGRIRRFYDGRAGELVAIALRAYDVHNLKTILRGVSKHIPPAEIATALLPIGELTSNALDELAGAPGPRVAIDLLASMRIPLAHPLIRLRVERPGAEIPEMELALDRWHFEQARRDLQESPDGAGLLTATLNLEADLANLSIVLRFAHAPAERQLLRKLWRVDGPDGLFVGPGRLALELLARAAAQDTLEAAVETLKDTPYEMPLRDGLEAYMQSGRLSGFEKHLCRFRLCWMAGLMARDPLGIGVLLGYLALKTNEVGNIRWVAQGIDLGLTTEEIRIGMEYPP
jgi:V/A-type H+-transporting ATPase subunit C